MRRRLFVISNPGAGLSRSTLIDDTVRALQRAGAVLTRVSPASIDAHLRFHRLFYDLSGHGVLQSMWNGWETKLRHGDHSSP